MNRPNVDPRLVTAASVTSGVAVTHVFTPPVGLRVGGGVPATGHVIAAGMALLIATGASANDPEPHRAALDRAIFGDRYMVSLERTRSTLEPAQALVDALVAARVEAELDAMDASSSAARARTLAALEAEDDWRYVDD